MVSVRWTDRIRFAAVDQAGRVRVWLAMLVLLIGIYDEAVHAAELRADQALAQSIEEDEPLPELAKGVKGRQLVVRFQPKVDRPKQLAILQKVASEVRFSPQPGLVHGLLRPQLYGESLFSQLAVVQVPENEDLGVAIKRLKRNPEVLYVEPNYRYRITQSAQPAAASERRPNDFDFSRLWGFDNTGQGGGKAGADIRAPAAWQIGTGDRRTVVAVIDTGIDYFHPDLQENLWKNRGEVPANGIDDDQNGHVDDVHGYDFVSRDSDPMDDHTHGTHVAGTIGAVGDNQRGVAGICWQVSLMAVKAFDEKGDGDLAGVVDAIRYAIVNGARVINASWGGDSRSRALEEAIAEANSKGVLVVAAMGNEKTDSFFYPAAYPDVMGVVASDPKDQRAMFSNFGYYADVAAPGENIFSTIPNNGYDYLSGTSMAAPHVSGLAALILSKRPEFTALQVANIIRNTVDPIGADKPVGSGRINAFKAMQVNAPLPKVSLTLPEVVQGKLPIHGSAAGSDFARYTLAYGKGEQPSEWTDFFTSDQPVESGVLFESLDTSVLDEGFYTIKLTGFNRDGHSASERVVFRVQNVHIAFPMQNDLLRAGETYEIRGTVFGGNRRYTLECGEGVEPTVWRDVGIILSGGGNEQVLGGVLAQWDTSQLRPNQFYTLKLRATADGNLVGEHRVRLIYLDGQLKKGFPRYLPFTGDFPIEDWRDLKVADLDGDGKGELILVDHGNSDRHPAQLLVFRHTGELWWSKTLDSGEPYSDIPVVGDVDNDGRLEIFVDVGDQRQLYGFAFDGSPLAGKWPVKLDAPRLGKVLADLDGDGFKELIGYSNDPLVTSEGSHQLVVFNRTGDVVRKWNVTACTTTNDVPRIFPAVANLDEDRDLEIVALSGCYNISAFKMEKEAPLWTAGVDGLLLSSPVIGDLNNDGTNEVVIAAASATSFTQGGLYAFNAVGDRWSGWPVLVDDSFTSTPALADMDGDGTLEVAVASAKTQVVHLLYNYGFPPDGWPVGPIDQSYINSSPVIGDVNGDGDVDIVMVSPGFWFLTALSGDTTNLGGIKAWSRSGRPVPLNANRSLSALMMESSAGKAWLKSAPPVLTDLDGDGKLDIVAVSIQDRAYAPLGEPTARKNRSSIYVWELDAPFQRDRMPWPTFRGSPRHTGAYERPPHINQPPVVADIPDQTIRAGTSFYPIELDQYVDDADHRLGELQWTVEGNQQLRISIDAKRVATITTPSADWTGTETVRFMARDPSGGTHSDRVVFDVRAVYDPPVAGQDEWTTLEDSSVEMDVLSNDTDPDGDSLRISHVGKPRSGAAKIVAGKVVYTPKADFSGSDQFNYTIMDGRGGMAIGLARVSVVPVNDAPAVTADLAITTEDSPVQLDVLENDLDPDDGDVLVLTDFTKPEHGKLDRGASGTFVYTPELNYAGLDKFSYKLRDRQGAESEAPVTILVKSVNDAPAVPDQEFTINKRAPLNFDFVGSDVEGDKLTFKIVKAPENGVLLAYPTVGNYTANKDFVGQDKFTYVANDGQVDSREATVSLRVVDANNPPVVESKSLKTKPNQALEIDLTAKDFDEDPLTYEITDAPKNGQLDGSGPVVTYRPSPGFLGRDQFKFQAGDAVSRSALAVVEIEVTDKNTAPVVKDSSIELKMNTSTNLVLNATDGEADRLTFTIVTPPAQGALSGTAPKFVYTPKTDFVGSDRLTFRASDGEAESELGTVTITVKVPNSPPEAQDQSIAVTRNTPAWVLLAVTDAEGDRLFSPILKGPKNGRIYGSGTSFTYVPNPGYLGSDSFTYKVWDGVTYSKPARVSINVTASPPQPDMTFESIQVQENGEIRLVLKVTAGNTYRVEVSPDLRGWEPLATQRAERQTLTITDTNAATANHRFYRAVMVR